MAEKIDFDVPLAPMPGASEDLARLIEALHSSGTLRALASLFGRLGPVTDVILTDACSEPGKNLIGCILFLGQALSKVPADDWEGVARGLQLGVSRAKHSAREAPPGMLSLARELRDPGTRRALHVLLTILAAVGSEIGKDARQSVTS